MLEEVVTVQWSGDVMDAAKIKSTRRPAWRKQFLSPEHRWAYGKAAEARFIAVWSNAMDQWILRRRA